MRDVEAGIEIFACLALVAFHRGDHAALPKCVRFGETKDASKKERSPRCASGAQEQLSSPFDSGRRDPLGSDPKRFCVK
jgi:hypothetical protein